MKAWDFIFVIFFGLLVAACQSSTVPPAQQVPSLPDPTAQLIPTEDQTEPLTAPTVDQEPQVEPTAEVVVRQGLAATDPATVNLANGTPTFVEFFAFW